MKKYLILMLISLISLNVCAGSNVQEFANRLTYAFEFGYDDLYLSQEWDKRLIALMSECGYEGDNIPELTKDNQEWFFGLISDKDNQKWLEAIDYTTQNIQEFIIDDYTKQVKNPYAQHMIMISEQEINMTILDFALFQKEHISYHCSDNGRYEPDKYEEAAMSWMESLIALLKRRGFKQTICNKTLKCVVVCLDELREGKPPCCVADKLRRRGLKVSIH